jgi:hypothetical protein
MALSIDKRNRRSQRHELQADAERHLEQTVMGRGVPGRCAGARPAQIRAGAKVLASRLIASLKQNG